LTDALFLYYRLAGVDVNDAWEIFSQDKAKISQSLYGLYYRETTGKYGGIPDEIISELAEKYQKTFTSSTADFLNDTLRKRGVKYLVWDKSNNSEWQLDQYTFLEKVTELGDFAIYIKN